MDEAVDEIDETPTDEGAGADEATASAKPTLLRNAIWALRLAAVAYLTVILLMTFLERRLVYPAPPPEEGEWNPTEGEHEEVWITSSDGQRVHGWYYHLPGARRSLLYCHGNGEHVAHNHQLMRRLRDQLDASVLIFDYRGYGKSVGKPTEAGVVADGLAAHRWLADRTGRTTDQVVLVGRSLGGGVVARLAEQQGAKALVLQNTFTRLTDAAASHFPWLPVRWVMRNRFDSIGHLAEYEGPLLVSHGTLDQVIPYQQGRNLYEACRSVKKRFVTLEGGGHNDPQPPHYYTDCQDFLEEWAP